MQILCDVASLLNPCCAVAIHFLVEGTLGSSALSI